MDLGRRSFLYGLAATGLASSAAAACACTPQTQVLVIGDSLTRGALNQGMGDGRPEKWVVSAQTGRSTNEGIEVAKGRNIASYALVIVALGTNDYLDTQAAYAARIDKMMSALKAAPRVIWVDVDSGTDHLAPAATGVNPAIAAAPARHPKLEVGPWNAYINAQPNLDDLQAADEIHYTPDGYVLRARWMEQLVDTR